MNIEFTIENDVAPLTLKEGVAAFDPVTLRLAGDIGAERGLHILADTRLNNTLPKNLCDLATINVTPKKGLPTNITATIDTGHLTWNCPDGDPEKTHFEDYKGKQNEGVNLGELPILYLHDSTVTRAPMNTSDGTPITAWFAELHTPLNPEKLDGFTLLNMANRWTNTWDNITTEPDATPAEADITVPSLNFTYKEQSGGLEILNDIFTIQQKFDVKLDENGARVIAITEIAPIGLPDMGSLPQYYTFGQNGPVLTWFTDDTPHALPFAILYTTSESWPETETPTW